MIELTHEGDIAVVRLVHGKANALDLELCDAIVSQFREIQASSARAVVLTGQGRMFSAGVDLLRLSGEGAPYVRRFLPALHRLYDALYFFPKPVVAARSTGMPSPAAACWPAAPTGGWPRATAAASA